MIQFIRTFWGDLENGLNGERYKNQISSTSNDDLDELVYVWGRYNYDFIKSKGFNCFLVSEENYDYNLASGHPFYDFKSFNHKLWALEHSLQEFNEVIYLDWDCSLINPIDDNFYNYLKNGNSLQVPLYIYPARFLDEMTELSKKDGMEFFSELKKVIQKHSYDWNGHYIIPCGGFIYCRDKNINLLKTSIEKNLGPAPDEIAILLYAQEKGYNLVDYIKNLEPNVILGKESDLDWWRKLGNEFDDFIKSKVKKQIYFEHK